MSHVSLNLPLAYPYVPPQRFTQRYSDEDAIMRGTLFPELDFPFQHYQIQCPLPKTPMAELMMIDFVCLELRLYLDINPEDKNAIQMYNEYKQKSAEAKQQIQDNWVFSPWPWEGDL